jgi:Core-2/I-Branching enzyme
MNSKILSIHKKIFMKIALCFLISGEHVLQKEEIWRKWIEPNKDILNVYFHYKDYTKIESEWIRNHAISPSHIVDTSYYHVVPAYLSLFSFAMIQDKSNEWFCILTDSCVPIMTPFCFREMFFHYYHRSIFSWKRVWWNVTIQRRANLRFLDPNFHLGHSPYFILCKSDVQRCLRYQVVNHSIYKTICDGGLANESIFAIMLKAQYALQGVINAPSHITDWIRMSSMTSPHVFKEGNKKDLEFLEKEICLSENKYAVFLRKVHMEFPDSSLYQLMEKREDKQKLWRRKCFLFFLECWLFQKRLYPWILAFFISWIFYKFTIFRI